MQKSLPQNARNAVPNLDCADTSLDVGSEVPEALYFRIECIAKDHTIGGTLANPEIGNVASRKKLEELLGIILAGPVHPKLLTILDKTVLQDITFDNIKLLANALTRPRLRRLLLTHGKISEAVLIQIFEVPERFLSPKIYNLIRKSKIGRSFWRRLESDLSSLPSDVATSALDRIRRCSEPIALFDVAASVRSRIEVVVPILSPTPSSPDPRLRFLNTIAEIEHEGDVMVNCLRTMARRYTTAGRCIAAWQGEERATVELSHGEAGWSVALAEGASNTILLPKTIEDIKTAVSTLSQIEPGVRKGFDCASTILAIAEAGQARGNQKAVQGIEASLRSIHGRSLESKNAFAIFSAKHGYIQFMSSIDAKSLICEISSHKYDVNTVEYISGDFIEFLDAAGFSWPKGTANFSRLFTVESEASFMGLAAMAFEVLVRFFRHPQDAPPKTKVYIPGSFW